MSEKQKKREIKVPLYDFRSQIAFIEQLCKEMEFDSVKLSSLIFADWIYTFQLATSKVNGNAHSAFYSYLQSSELTAKNLSQLRKDLQNETKDINNSH